MGLNPVAVNVNTGALSYSGEVSGSVLPGPNPSDHGYLAWSSDPSTLVNQTSHTAGVVYGTRVDVRSSISVTNVVVFCTTAGATLTSGQCFAGLYNSAGSRVAVTATQHTAWASTGVKAMVLASGPFTLSPGFYWVALVANGTTPPKLGVGSLFSVGVNAGLAAAGTRFGSQLTGQTSLPASLTPSSWLQDANAPWVALS